ncbi:MAG: coniferyl aldehyde dehydrogenase [Amphritea sp.]
MTGQAQVTPIIPPVSELESLLGKQRQAYRDHGILSLAERKRYLKMLEDLLRDNQEAIVAAISKDFGNRASQETRLLELYLSIDGIKYARRKLRKWMKPQSRGVSIWFAGARNRLIPQPLGVVGIITPWNYPLFLSIGPLTSALAAGNRCMIKMAANSTNLSALLHRLFTENFPPELISIVPGARGSEFSALPFDHIVFTGSGETGRTVMGAAAKNLTPVTLELGGKSPTIIAEDYPVKTAAERFLFAKYMNAGQTCVSPDYLFIPEGKLEEFVRHAQEIVSQRYPDISNSDYTSIIDDRAYERLVDTVKDAEALGAKVVNLVPGSKADPVTRKLPPQLLTSVTDEMRVMQEEIFGPLLPIKTYRSLDEVIDYINDRDRPLGLYLFSNDKKTQQKVIDSTLSGGVCINDAATHVAQHDMPFGGVGASGMGHYHAREGFLSLSKMRPVFRQGPVPWISLMFPPYGKRFDWLYKLMLKL